jgi:serine/threonine protein kinase
MVYLLIKISEFQILRQFNLVAATKNQFMSMYVIGKGGFGRVWKIQEKRSANQYAMKEMSKQRILSK